MRRLSAVVVLLAALTAGCGGGSTSIADIAVGDCFNDPTELIVFELDLMDCAEPHDNEVYANLQVQETLFPGDEVLSTFAYDACLDPFEAYVAESYTDSRLDYAFFTPTAESWANGDRAVTCFLYAADLSKLSGSAARLD
ncbi:MAG: septum formation family protein [Acidimicrobiia bacterium]|nr:septum formation family protein [Acidimicrobiia bacterium]